MAYKTKHAKRRYQRTSTRKVVKSSRPTVRRRPRASLWRPPAPTVQRGLLPFGQSYLARLPYSQTYTNTNNTFSTAVSNTFCLNSMYDPDVTGVGHQPYQYDQLTTVYKLYRVYGAKIYVTFSNPTSDGVYVGYRIRNSTNTVATGGQTIDYIKEMGNTAYKVVNNTGSQVARFSMYVPINLVFGVNKATVLTDNAYRALYNANPGYLAYLDLWTIDSTGTASTIGVSVKITYYSQFSDRQAVAQS